MSANPLPRERISSAILLGGIVLASYLCYRLSLPFLSPLLWAFTLAVLFGPLHAWLRRSMTSSAGAASVAVGIIAAVVVIPALFVLAALLGEAVKGANLINAVAGSGRWRSVLESNSWLSPAFSWVEERVNIQELIGTAAAWLTSWSASLIRGSFAGFVNLLLTFYFLFYFLRDGEKARRFLKELLPLSAAEFAKVGERMQQTVQATVYGTVVVAALQGGLGGLVFWWLDMPAPFFWGVVMGLLAVVPFLGAFVIWAPVAVYLALAGQWFDASVLALWGTAVIGLIDNVLYPVLVGDRLMMHTVPSFIAVVGGLLLFGAHGVILGPLVLSAAVILLQIWRQRAAYLDADRPSSSV